MLIQRTNSSDPRFQVLIAHLDAYLSQVNKDVDPYFRALNHVPEIRNTVVLLDENVPIACGAFKPFDERTIEIKRMFVTPERRSQGCAQQVLKELEIWGRELGYQRAILETAKTMHDAVRFYQRAGYTEIPRFGAYAHIESSICFEKRF